MNEFKQVSLSFGEMGYLRNLEWESSIIYKLSDPRFCMTVKYETVQSSVSDLQFKSQKTKSTSASLYCFYHY